MTWEKSSLDITPIYVILYYTITPFRCKHTPHPTYGGTMDTDSIDRLDIRVIKSLLADIAVELDSIKETVEGLEQNDENIDIQLNDISSSLNILLQNAELE